MKHFWLSRHAKSEHSAPGPGWRDFDRDLNNRGRRDGKQMQQWFVQRAEEQPECRPDWLVTSSAVRAAATSEFVAQGFGLTANQTLNDKSLYNASPETLLDALHSTPVDANCMAVVAHNPGMTWLVNALSVSGAYSEATSIGSPEEIENLPTFGCALFQANVDNWSDITKAVRLLLVTPKTLP